jgi:hypothetical protein
MIEAEPGVWMDPLAVAWMRLADKYLSMTSDGD